MDPKEFERLLRDSTPDREEIEHMLALRKQIEHDEYEVTPFMTEVIASFLCGEVVPNTVRIEW